MSSKDSRYQNAAPFFSADGKAPVFKGSRARSIGPATGVLEYTVKADDRLDLLALYFYVDSQKWWRILDANPEVVFGPDLNLSESVGETILIPRVREPGSAR